MSKGLIAAIALVGSIGYVFFKQINSNDNILMQRAQLIKLVIQLRKHIFSTLREVAYSANCLKIAESGIESRKIKDIIMKDGASAQKKLKCIEDILLQKFNLTRQKFEQSCRHYTDHDIQIKMLLKKVQTEIQNALDGTIQFYHGPLPKVSGTETIKIYREITLRRMRIIESKVLKGLTDLQCLKLEMEIEQYLESQKIKHSREPNQKIFISVLQYHYKVDSEFKEEFQALERQFEDFIEEIKKKKEKKP